MAMVFSGLVPDINTTVRSISSITRSLRRLLCDRLPAGIVKWFHCILMNIPITRRTALATLAATAGPAYSPAAFIDKAVVSRSDKSVENMMKVQVTILPANGWRASRRLDEKSHIQALNRTQPVLPMGLGYVEGVTHD